MAASLMRVLVTRPAEDAAAIAEKLAAMGHDALVAPLLAVHFLEGPPLALDGVQAVLATSANGVRALARRSAARGLPVFAVGPQTAAEARALGFADVRNADGDALALAAQVTQWAQPEAGALLHAAGERSGALSASLAARGYKVRSEILYTVEAAERLPDTTARALAEGRLDAALFFSPRSARVFARLTQAAGLSGAATRLFAACISARTAEALAPLAFSGLRIATKPNQDALLHCLETPTCV